jgi:hypothetical protein
LFFNIEGAAIKRLTRVFVLVASIFTPVVSSAAIPSIPYGDYNVTASVSMGRSLYPDAIREYFDEKTKDVVLHSPTLDRMGVASNDHASDLPGRIGRAVTNEELISFIDALPDAGLRRLSLGKFPSYSSLGVFENAFEVPFLIFSSPPTSDAEELKALGKPIIYLQGGIHGHETSGTDALLAVAGDLADDENHLLEKISVIILPRLNMDGAWRYRRGTNSANPDFDDLDQNRDSISTISPQMRALRNMLATFRPDVGVDFHEMGFRTFDSAEYTAEGLYSGYGFYNEFDLATLVAHPANVPARVTELAYELQSGVWEALASVGLKASAYYAEASVVPGYMRLKRYFDDGAADAEPPGYITYPSQIMEGAPDESISDSAASLMPSVTLLFEARSVKVLTNYKTRVYSLYRAAHSVLEQVASRPAEFRDAVAEGAEEISAMGNNPDNSANIVLWSKQREVPSCDVESLALNKKGGGVSIETLVIDKFHRNDILTPVMSVKRPYAYIISADGSEADAIASRLALTGIGIARLAGNAEIEAEAYTVNSVVPANHQSLSYSSRSGDYFPKSNSAVTYAINDVSASSVTRTFRSGSYVVLMSDPSANLAALALEPMANCNLANYWYSLVNGEKKNTAGYIAFGVGEEYPVYRVMSAVALGLVSVTAQAPFLSGAYVKTSIPVNPSEVDAAAAFCYRFAALNPITGAAPSSFTMTLPSSRGKARLRSWSLYNWSSGILEEVTSYEDRGVPAVLVSSQYISPEGEVAAAAFDRDLAVHAEDVPHSGGSGCNTLTWSSLLLPAMIFLVKSKH